MTKSLHLSRRGFATIGVATLGTIIAVTIGLPPIAYVVGPALKTSKSNAWIPLGEEKKFPVDEPTLVSFTQTKVNGWEKTIKSYGVYVVKPANSDIYVLSNVCTHLSCRVNWRKDKADFVCPCHDGIFNIQGIVVSGPPPKPLYRYETKIEDGTLYIRLQEG
jgi:menaquinol-cytochrome c reductase iron-sulfur subunit